MACICYWSSIVKMYCHLKKLLKLIAFIYGQVVEHGCLSDIDILPVERNPDIFYNRFMESLNKTEELNEIIKKTLAALVGNKQFVLYDSIIILYRVLYLLIAAKIKYTFVYWFYILQNRGNQRMKMPWPGIERYLIQKYVLTGQCRMMRK